jgi:cell division protein FtsB
MYENFVYKVSSKKKLAFHAMLLILLLYFVFHAIGGNRGIIAYFKLNQQMVKSTEELDILRADRVELEHRVNLLKSPLDRDMLDEQARKILGVARANEKVFEAREEKK